MSELSVNIISDVIEESPTGWPRLPFTVIGEFTKSVRVRIVTEAKAAHIVTKQQYMRIGQTVSKDVRRVNGSRIEHAPIWACAPANVGHVLDVVGWQRWFMLSKRVEFGSRERS